MTDTAKGKRQEASALLEQAARLKAKAYELEAQASIQDGDEVATRRFEVDVRVTEVMYATIEVEVDDTPDAIQAAKDAAIQRYWDEGDDALRHTEIADTDVEVPAFQGKEVTEL